MWIDRGFIGESFVVPFFHDSREIKLKKNNMKKIIEHEKKIRAKTKGSVFYPREYKKYS